MTENTEALQFERRAIETEEDFCKVFRQTIATLGQYPKGIDPTEARKLIGESIGFEETSVKAIARILQSDGLLTVEYARGLKGMVLTESGRAVYGELDAFMEEMAAEL